jgi:hypothetical protein
MPFFHRQAKEKSVFAFVFLKYKKIFFKKNYIFIKNILNYPVKNTLPNTLKQLVFHPFYNFHASSVYTSNSNTEYIYIYI